MSDEPKTVAEWVAYLHNAASVPKDSPDYPAAREATAYALQRIHNLNVAGNVQDQAGLDRHVGPIPGTAAALLHGASQGTGEVIAGITRGRSPNPYLSRVRNPLGSDIPPDAFREGAQAYREGLSNIEVSNPTLAPAAELVGQIALPGGTVGAGVGGAIKAGVPLTIRAGAGVLGRGALAGAVPGAMAGFSAGGADPGDMAARLSGAKGGALLGAILGGLSTGVGMGFARRHVERAADIRAKGTTRAVQEARLAAFQRAAARQASPVSEGAPGAADAAATLRDQLLKAGVLPENVDAQVARQLGVRAQQLPVEGEVAASLPPNPQNAATEANAALTPEQLAAQPLGQTPPLAESNAAPGVQDAQVRAARGALRPDIANDPIAQQIARSGMGSPSKARPGHPIWFGESAPTRSPEVRAGELLLPKANPTIGPTMAEFRQLPTAQLVEAFKNAPDELKQLLIVEFRRRHIAIPDLGITP